MLLELNPTHLSPTEHNSQQKTNIIGCSESQRGLSYNCIIVLMMVIRQLQLKDDRLGGQAQQGEKEMSWRKWL